MNCCTGDWFLLPQMYHPTLPLPSSGGSLQQCGHSFLPPLEHSWKFQQHDMNWKKYQCNALVVVPVSSLNTYKCTKNGVSVTSFSPPQTEYVSGLLITSWAINLYIPVNYKTFKMCSWHASKILPLPGRNLKFPSFFVSTIYVCNIFMMSCWKMPRLLPTDSFSQSSLGIHSLEY